MATPKRTDDVDLKSEKICHRGVGPARASISKKIIKESISDDDKGAATRLKQQIGAFLILEFRVLFHSIIIGLNLGVVGAEFSTLYPVLVFY